MSRPSFDLTEIVRAGAGAGKTTQLTSRVIQVAGDYYQANKHWPKLIVTTFTKKATQELRERLVAESCEMGRGDLLDYISSSGKLHISTIDGVFSRFLRSYAHLVGWESQFTVIGEHEAFQLAKATLRRILHSNQGNQFFSLMDAYGFEGTTKALLKLIRLKAEFPDSQTCSEEDFKEAIKSMARPYGESLLQALGEVSHFNSSSWPTYKEKCEEIGRTLCRGEVSEALLEGLGRKPSAPKGESDNEFKVALDNIKEWVKKVVIAPSAWEIYFCRAREMEALSQIFKEEFNLSKEKTGKFQMSDLGLLVDQMIREEPQLAAKFAEEWNYWFVDEYQDTSPLQVRALNHLIGDRPYFFVGDPQQSIYLFRGARSEVFEAKEREVCAKGGKLSLLDKNYRSRPELLYFFNDFFSGISSKFAPMQPREGALDPRQCVATFSIADLGNEELGKTYNEDVAIYNHIQELLSQGEEYEDFCILGRTHNQLNEIARFLDAQGLPLHIHAPKGFHERREVLDAVGLLKFIMNPHDNFNLIMVLRSPWFHVEDGVIVNALSSHTSSDSTLLSYWGRLSLLLEGDESIESLRRVLEKVSEIGVSETFKRALVECGIFDLARTQDPSGRRESNLWKLLAHLDDEERQPGFNYLRFINRLLGGEREDGGDAVPCLEPRRINLMTVHASKGLKFKHIILPRMDRRGKLTKSSSMKDLIYMDETRQRWTLAVPIGEEQKKTHSPVAQRIFEQLAQREKEEGDRLLYVALTRAEESVFLSWAEKVEEVEETNRGGRSGRATSVEGGSWAEKIGLSLEEGCVTKDFYSFKVQRGCWEKYSQATNSNKNSEERTPIEKYEVSASPVQREKLNKVSVSQLLEDPLEGLEKKSKEEKSKEEEKPKEEKLDLISCPPSVALEPRVSDSFLKEMNKSSEGVLIHRVMESLRYRESIDIDDYGPWLRNEFGERYKDIEEAIKFIQELREPPMRELLKTGFVEWGFQMKRDVEKGEGGIFPVKNDNGGGLIVEGVIDLWGEVESSHGEKVCWLVDYKSGSKKYIEKAFRQLSFYGEALRAYGVRSQLKKAVVYPLSGAVEIRD